MSHRTTSPELFLALWALLVGASGCSASVAMRAARSGDVATLGSALRTSAVTDSAARDLAKATASGIVERAKTPAGAAEIVEFESCARSIDDALSDRAEKPDELGATAAMVRVDAGIVPAESMVRHARLEGSDFTPAQEAWRAVGARSLITTAAGGGRRILIADPDEQVRVAVLRAAIEAGDAADADAVIEAARLDPAPLARTLAIRAAGAIGGERVVLALHDLWATAADAEREAIAAAWGTSRSLHVGGARELGLAIEGQGAPAIAAALVLSRSDAAQSTDAASAIALLERAIHTGTTRDRIFAIATAPLSSTQIRDAIVTASTDADEAVALAAMSRRLGAVGNAAILDENDRAVIVKRLVAMSEGATTRSIDARAALARGHALEVHPIFARDRASSDLRVREAAGVGLATLGDLSGAAVLLADRDERLRARVACAILRAH